MALNYLAAKRAAVAGERGLRGYQDPGLYRSGYRLYKYINIYIHTNVDNGCGGGRGVTRYPVIAGHLVAR